jgi:hypothetical protein
MNRTGRGGASGPAWDIWDVALAAGLLFIAIVVFLYLD